MEYNYDHSRKKEIVFECVDGGIRVDIELLRYVWITSALWVPKNGHQCSYSAAKRMYEEIEATGISSRLGFSIEDR